MAYNNYFPTGYQPYYLAQQSVPNAPQQQQGIIWVQGEAGAKSYLVAPNATVQLWDSERQTIYLKSADASGMPSIKILDYTIRDQNVKQTDNYATKEDIEQIKKRIEALERVDYE